MEAKILDGKSIAQGIKDGLKSEIEVLKKEGSPLKLVAVQVGESEASGVYTRAQKKNCEKLGIDYELTVLDEGLGQEEIVKCIQKLNQDNGVTGIILQLPLPQGMSAVEVQSTIDVGKDVEGVNPANLGWITYGKPRLTPCTAAAVMELIETAGVDLYGKEAVMVGHSDIVGKPVALLLLNKFVTTSVCHIATGERGNLAEYVRKAELLIVAVGKANLVKGEWIREGAIVIDVGINRVEGKILGDVEFEGAKERAGWITPVPGGVGPVTTAMLLKNTVMAAKKSHK
jgi:methylenetetrahydrofolate dehydrogenase (NADP+)/methenyltetrahydrofolate cyclohydrolase